MDDPNRQEDQLVLVHYLDFRAARDFGGALNHDPVLGAMIMALQGKLLLRRNDDAFGLVA